MSVSIRQNSKIADVTYIIPLTLDEAERLVASIRGHLNSADAEIIELHDRDGWKALGYPSWRECVQARFNISQAQGYRMLDAARVRHNLKTQSAQISPIGERLPAPNDGQARELAKVSAEAQREVWENVVKTTNGKPTAKAVAAHVESITRPAPKPVPSGKKARSTEPQDARSLAHSLLDRASKPLVDDVLAILMDRMGGVS